MLVPTMTPEEIHAEIFKDAAWLQDEINNHLFKEYGKHVKRRTRFPDMMPYLISSKITNIKYYIIFFSYRRGEWDKPHFIVYTKYTHESGRTLVYLENGRGMGIRIYTSHFIQRYLERESKLVSKYQLMSNTDPEFFFILRNREVQEMKLWDTIAKNDPNDPITKQVLDKREQSKYWQDPDYNRFMAACSKGVCLCERHKTNPLISIYDTYLSVEILKYDQLFDFILAYSNIFLKEMHNMYPRQSLVWGKEWNDLVDSIRKNEDPNRDVVSEFVAKIDELAKRYPLHELL